MTTRWLITGAGGQFGSVVHQMLQHQGESVLALVRRSAAEAPRADTVPLDICDHASVTTLLREVRPAIVIHAAAIANTQTAFEDPALARLTNVDATEHLAHQATQTGARLVFISTDMVFNGREAPYDEAAIPKPVSVYGQTKWEAEQRVRAVRGTLVVRLPLMYGLPAVPRATTFMQQVAALRAGSPLRLFDDEFRTPMALRDAARACVVAAQSAATGVLHIAGPERLSRLQMGRIMARALGASEAQLVAVSQRDLESAEPRPADISLTCGRFTRLFGDPPGRPMKLAVQEIVRDLPNNERG